MFQLQVYGEDLVYVDMLWTCVVLWCLLVGIFENRGEKLLGMAMVIVYESIQVLELPRKFMLGIFDPCCIVLRITNLL